MGKKSHTYYPRATVYPKLGLIFGGVATKDKPLGRRGVGWHVVVCYGGPEWFRFLAPATARSL